VEEQQSGRIAAIALKLALDSNVLAEVESTRAITAIQGESGNDVTKK